MNFTMIPKTKWPFSKSGLERVYKSKDFLVQIFEQKDDAIRITINRVQYLLDEKGKPIWIDKITWDEISEIKRSLGFDHLWGVEIYPPEKYIVNVANMRHIFLVKEKPIFGWRNDAEIS